MNMSESVDLVGDVSLIVQVIILFILVLGVPLVKGSGSPKNFLRHGYLTAFALGLHTILVITIMIVLAMDGLANIFALPMLNIVLSIAHIFTGFVALALAYIVVAFWFTKSLKSMACYRVRKLMFPLTVIWVISLILGGIIHLGGLF